MEPAVNPPAEVTTTGSPIKAFIKSKLGKKATVAPTVEAQVQTSPADAANEAAATKKKLA